MKQQLRNRYEIAKKKTIGFQRFPRTFKEELNAMQDQIKNHHAIKNMWQCCSSRKKHRSLVDFRFVQAFRSMSIKQKIEYYEKTIQYAKKDEKNSPEFVDTENQEISIMQEAGFHSWKTTLANLSNFKVHIRDGTNIDSRNYIMRKSNRQDSLCYVFQSINKVQPTRYRFKYANEQDEKRYHKKLVNIFQKGHYQNVYRNVQAVEEQKRARTYKSSKQKQFKKFYGNNLNSNIYQTKNLNVTSPTTKLLRQKKDLTNALGSYIHHNIIEKDDNSKNKNYRNSIRKSNKNKTFTPVKVYHKNIFKTMFPGMGTQQIDRTNNFKQLQINDRLGYKILTYYSHKQQNIKCAKKLTMKSSYTPQILIKCLTNSIRLSQWHPCIKTGKILMILDSQNSMISHQVNKYSQSPQFEFFYISHCFQKDKIHYLVQKSIQFENFQINNKRELGLLKYGLWKFQKTDSGCDISLEILMDHGQDVSPLQEIQYMKQYLKYFPYIEEKFLNSTTNQRQLKNYLETNWCISDSYQDQQPSSKHFNDIDTQQFGLYSDLYEESIADYYSIQSKQSSQVQIIMEQENVTEKKQLLFQKDKSSHNYVQKQQLNVYKSSMQNQYQKTQNTDKLHLLAHAADSSQVSSPFIQRFSIKLDSQGLIYVDNSFLSHKFKTEPYSTDLHYEQQTKEFDNPVLKDDFKLNHQGQMVLTNTDKLGKISEVMAFLTKKLFNNLLGGKSILNISLPVIICAKDSNLQRLSKSWKYAPTFLEQASQTKSIVERFKLAIAFKMGYAVSYVNIQKPFNPILGETYQAWIKGCPIYAEQISHHPPITSLLFYGRGYKISSTLEVKVQVKLNSGKGFNQGLTKIEFDDGQTVYVTFPKGEVSGLVMGNKKFQLYDHTYVFDIQNRLFMECLFQQKIGTFQKKKWKDRCQIQGKVLKTTQKFMTEFVDSKFTKKITIKDIEETLHSVSGKWLSQLLIDGQKYFDAYQDRAYEVIQEPYPLPSHSNFRQDLYYRKVDDQRSQVQKQRLEQLQRFDRKLRDHHK